MLGVAYNNFILDNFNLDFNEASYSRNIMVHYSNILSVTKKKINIIPELYFNRYREYNYVLSVLKVKYTNIFTFGLLYNTDKSYALTASALIKDKIAIGYSRNIDNNLKLTDWNWSNNSNLFTLGIILE